MHFLRRNIRVSLCALGLCASSIAAAQPADDAKLADRLYANGQKAARGAKLEEALQSFEALWAIEKTPRAACNLGHTYLVLKRFADAAPLWDRCYELAGKDFTPRQKALREEALAKVVKLELVVEPAGFNLEVNGSQRPSSDVLYLSPGQQTVLVSAPGYLEQTVVVDGKAGATERREIKLAKREAAPSAPAVVPAVHDEPSTPQQPPPVEEHSNPHLVRNVVVISGAVLSAASFVGYALARGAVSAKQTSLSDLRLAPNECASGPTPRCDSASQLSADLDDAASRGNVFLGLGIGLGVASVATFFLWPEPRRNTSGLGWQVGLDSDGGAVAVRGAF